VKTRSRNSALFGANKAQRSGRVVSVALAFWAIMGSSTVKAQWREIGPAPISSGQHGGRVTAVATHPSDADVFYIGGAGGGVWRYDGAWTPLTDNMPSLTIGALAVDPNQPETIYAGTGESNLAPHCYYGVGLYKSEDGGETWTVYGAKEFAGRAIARVAISKANSSVIYVAVQRAGGIPVRYAAKDHPLAQGDLGIFRSDDGGETWTHLTADQAKIGASDVAVDPNDENTVYAALGGFEGDPAHGVYKSTDGGKSWSKLSPFKETLGRTSLAISKDGEVIYALGGRGASAQSVQGATLIDLMKSTDGGMTWNAQNISDVTSGFGWYMNVVGVHPEDSDDYYYGGMNLMRGGSDVTPNHVDMHAIAWDASGRLIAGDDGGVHRSSNNGSSYEALNDGLGINQFYPSVSVSGEESFMLGGLQDNGTILWNGKSWTSVLGGDGGYTAIHPNNSNVLFAEIQHTGALYRSSDGGNSFNSSASGINSEDRDAFFNPIVFNPEDPNTLLYATQRLYRSTNGGQSWQAFSGDLTTGAALSAIRTLSYAPSDANTVWVVTTDGHVEVSGDGGKTFDIVLEDIADWRRVSRDLAIMPDDADTVYLGVPRFGVDQVLKTSDRGKTWESLDGNLPDVPVNAMELIVGSDEQKILLAGTDNELYLSCDEGKKWSVLDDSLPNALIVEVRYQAQFERIVVITMGRGAWIYEGATVEKLLEICDEASDDETSDSSASDESGDTDDSQDSELTETDDSSDGDDDDDSESDGDASTASDDDATTDTEEGEEDDDDSSDVAVSSDDDDDDDANESDVAGDTGCACASLPSTTSQSMLATLGLSLLALGVRRRRRR
jgi:photosystem II stability/assembly factor-like uncharacterized protein